MFKDFGIGTFVFLNKIKKREITRYSLVKLADGQCQKLAKHQLCTVSPTFWLVVRHSRGRPDAYATIWVHACS